MDNKPKPVFAKSLQNIAESGIKHGFFTREGGVSEGIYESLNVGRGSSDEKENIAKNREIIANYFLIPHENLYNAYQIHSNIAVIVDENTIDGKIEADGLVTKKSNLALGVLTADCGPLLFADPLAKVIGCAHAGWRGALFGIVENTLLKMEELGANRKNIIAALGPCIGPENYEVGEDFFQKFIEYSEKFASFFKKSEKIGYYIFNLWAFILYRLEEAGLGGECLSLCTYEDEQRFFSYRRKTHREEADYGRQISVIMLEDRE